MTEAFHRLRIHPRLGHPRDDIFPGCRTMQVEQHLIFYHLPDAGSVEVLRILHQRQDPDGKVSLAET